MNIRNSFLYLIFLLVTLSACEASTASPAVEKTNPPNTSSEIENPSPLATFGTDSGGYIFQEAKFSLVLPQGWQVLGPLEASGNGKPSYEIYILGSEPEASGGPSSSKVVIADASQWTPELFVNSQCNTCQEHPFEQTTLDGKEALRTQIGGGGVPFLVTWYFVENNGKLIALAIHDPETLEPLPDVLQSIRFE